MNNRKKIGLTAAQVLCAARGRHNIAVFFSGEHGLFGNRDLDKTWFETLMNEANEDGVTDREVLWEMARQMTDYLGTFFANPKLMADFSDSADFFEQHKDHWLSQPDVNDDDGEADERTE